MPSATADRFDMGYQRCSTQLHELIIASDTGGRTYHRTENQVWDKGVRDGGATTYTGTWSAFVEVEAPTIHTAGTRCVF